MDEVATLRAVDKRFGSIDALRGLDLTITAGTTALLGRNGAGKTTVLNVLTGVVRPDGGEVRVCGGVAGSVDAVSVIARQLEFPGTAATLTTRRIRLLLGLSGDETARLIDCLNGFDVPDSSLAKMSRGNQLKFALSVAFARDRELLLLDEPTSGLDAVSLARLVRLLEDRWKTGRSTILATHQPTLTPHVFDRVVLLDMGRLMFQGTLVELVRQGSDADQTTPFGQYAAALAALGNTEVPEP